MLYFVIIIGTGSIAVCTVEADAELIVCAGAAADIEVRTDLSLRYEAGRQLRQRHI